MKRLRLVGGAILLAWLMALGWLVWRQRNLATVSPPLNAPPTVTLAWHARCTSA